VQRRDRHLLLVALALSLSAAGTVITPSIAQADPQPCGFDYVSDDVSYTVCLGFGAPAGPGTREVHASYSGIPAYPRMTLRIGGVQGGVVKADQTCRPGRQASAARRPVSRRRCA
jgi:hypothetical protein